MNKRQLGGTGFNVSEISLGTWQVGGKWGSGFDDSLAESILDEAIDAGVNFIDTADVYENRRSEAAVGRVIRRRSEEVYLATKCGRFISPHVDSGYTPEALRGYVETSLKNSGLETLDLIQLHCPPTAVYYRPEIFELFERLRTEGKIRHLGVSVEKVEEALKAVEYPNVAAVQIIFNIFRRRPAELFFEQARKKNIGIIVRVPLASGLLTGLYDKTTTFGDEDHRSFNREGAAFDRGETFSGVPFEAGLNAVKRLKSILPPADNLAPCAIRWILDHPEVSTVIPGASRPEHLHSNLAAASLPPLSDSVHRDIAALYESEIRDYVHHFW